MAITRSYDPVTGALTVVSDGAVVMTGPIKGYVTLPDGTVYDVNEEFIEVDPAHAEAVAQAVGERYATEGHPSDSTFALEG